MMLKTTNILSISAGLLRKVTQSSVFITVPLFFVLDSCNQFWGWVPIGAGFTAFVAVAVSMVLLFFVLRLVMQAETAQILMIWAAINYLFFKLIKDWLIATGFKLFGSYSFFLPFLFLLGVLIFFFIRRLSSTRTKRTVLYLNFLFLFLVIVEVGKYCYNYFYKPVQSFSTEKVKFVRLADHQYPDIFILQLDEYAGLYTLNNGYEFSNGRFVDDLKDRSFQVVQYSNSNYNGTPFSVLSLLNMGYIKGLTKTEVASAIAYSKSVEEIKTNYLMQFFNNNGYKVSNHSFFEVEQTRSLNYLFLPVKERLMLDKTFGSVLVNDLLCSVNSNSFHFFINDLPARIDNYNQEVIKRSYQTIISEKKPVFMFSHFMMPHGPFLRASNGKLRNIGAAYRESNKGLNIDSYLNYLKYCNSVSLEMIDSIQTLKPNSIIVLLSDHGLRNARQGDRKYSEFNNFMAIYSPQKATLKIPDSLCTVNVFRLIMNQHFGQNFPMLVNRSINVNLGLKD